MGHAQICMVPLVLGMVVGIDAAGSRMTADGQEKQDAKEAAQDENDASGILSGPKVQEESLRGDGSFGTPNRRRDGAMRVPAGQWFELLRELELDADPRRDIAAIVTRWQEAQREFRTNEGEELRRLQREFRRRNQSDVADDDTLTPEAREELLAKIRRLRDARPDVAPYQQKIWQLLTEDQQETMRASLAELRQEIIERRRQRRQARQQDQTQDQTMEMSESMAGSMGESAGRREQNPRDEDEMYGRGLDRMGLQRLRFLRKHQAQGDQTFERSTESERNRTRRAPER